MKRIFYLFILVLGALLTSCNSEKSLFELENNARTEVFTITTSTDTVLHTLEGVEIIISKSSFVNPPAQLDLQVRTVMDTYSAIAAGCITLTTDGTLLESDGMIYLQSSPATKINPEAPITIKIPHNSMASDMKIFKGTSQEGLITWEASGDLVKNESLQAIERGEKIYEQNCITCHSKNLRERLSGPPLGNLTLHRATSYLDEFIRNSPDLIFVKKDQLAICVYEDNKMAAMNPFPTFTDQELTDIYTFIESESRNQEIGIDEIDYVNSCLEKNDKVYFSDADGQILDSMAYITTDTMSIIQSGLSRDMGNRAKVPQFYEFKILEMGWYNVDYFAGTEEREIENFKIEIPGHAPKDIRAFLVFENRDIIISMQYVMGSYHLLNGYGKDLIQFPEGEKLKIIAFGEETGESLQFGMRSIISQKTNNEYSVEMNLTDIKEVKQQVNAE